ncbi:MAG: UDP-N-acetylglucosamine--N-acetylmuramyl-(pentapeptide) pyrophosphoryl-undecaprenol N-acetylglucosamine transferase [Microgenomates group bacterium]|jgi:UDP-N-acetylglucosamine--N-acetylmuramyl-(pentapeptide) pyrophosphoryl-undecaprenol N-acetylglucosamine transferase
MKTIITGTHLTPSLAVIEELKKVSGMEVTYFGRSSTMEGDRTKSVESQVLSGLGIRFISVTSGRLQRSFTIHTIPSLLKIPIGFLEALYYLFDEEPDVVLSMGGYTSVPVVFAAWLLKIPVIIHEQTLVPGLANTINSWFADKIAISFPENVFYKNNKTVLTGNPLRKEVLNPQNTKDEELKKIVETSLKNKQPLILITGGNQGSHAINQAVTDNLNELTQNSYIIHQTGDSKFADFDKLQSYKKSMKNPEKYVVRKWINSDDWGFLLKKVDLVISRAGINTLLELSLFAIPTIAVPLPASQNKEQAINADFFEKVGLVKVLLQNNLNKNLTKNILEIINNLDDWEKTAKQASKLVIPDAAKRLALEIVLLAKKRT